MAVAAVCIRFFHFYLPLQPVRLLKTYMNLQQIWTNVSKERRHINLSNQVRKNQQLLHRALRAIKVEDINRIVDWGPGGGHLPASCVSICDKCHRVVDKPLAQLDFVDIIDDSFDLIIENNKKYFEDTRGHLLSNDLDQSLASLDIKNCDLLIAFSVIYHMPSIDYATKVINYWNNTLQPRYIITRNVLTKKDNWDQDEYEYMRGNIMAYDYFRNLFDKYQLVKSFTVGDLIKHKEYPPHMSMVHILEIQ